MLLSRSLNADCSRDYQQIGLRPADYRGIGHDTTHPDSREEEANRFASNFLIPPAAWQLVVQAQPKSATEVRALAKRLGIAPSILVGRMQRENLLPWTHLNALKIKLAFKTAAGHSTAIFCIASRKSMSLTSSRQT